MKKFPIGFSTTINEEPDINVPMEVCKGVIEPKRSVVQVYFPHRNMGWAYYNDSFDLKVGDFVYVEGKLEGYRGQVVEVNYSFKIKLSDYKRVIAVVDTSVKGDIYLAGTHLVSFDESAIPFSKVVSWFMAPEGDDEYEIGNDDASSFPLNDLSQMKISQSQAESGKDCYSNNGIVYLEMNKTHGRAIAQGSEYYVIEFDYVDDGLDCDNAEISNIKCSCFCSGACKHEFAAMLQLKETLEFIFDNYENEYNGYFAAVSKEVFMNTVMSKSTSGKISFEV